MNKIKYAVLDALMNYHRRWGLNIIVSVSFALGMILPILCLGNINIFVENISTIRLKNNADVWVAYFDESAVSGKELASSLKDIPLEICNYAISAQKRANAEINGYRNDLFICCLTEEWLEFENCKVVEGSLDLFSEENVCLIELSFAENHGGLKVGDTITINEDAYMVNGIFSSFNYYGNVLLLISNFEYTDNPDLVVTKLYFRTEGKKSDDEEILNMLIRSGMPAKYVRSGEEIYRKDLKSGIYKSLSIIGVGLVSFIFSAINICLVLIGKMNLDKRNYGIRMAIGASNQLIFLSALMENLICFFAAYLCDIGLIYLLKPTYPEGLTVVLNARVYAVAFIFGIIMTTIVTSVAMFRLRKHNLVELFERVS